MSKLELLTFPSALGVLSPSPFCLKADVLLQMSGLPFDRVPADPRKAPKKKLPVLRVGERLIADSYFIQKYLEDEQGVAFDDSLSDEQRATGELMRRTIEEQLYWVQVHYRWEDYSEEIRDTFFGMLPGPMRRMVFALVLRQLRRDMQGHGISRHSREEMEALTRPAVEAIATIIRSNGPFVFGDEPTSIDAVLFGLTANILVPSMPSPLSRQVEECPEIVEHYNLMHARYGALPGRGA